MKFDFSKSNDLQNKFQLDKMEILNKNVLYITHELDKALKILRTLERDANLQKQVDEYFDETSPQTESSEQ